MGKDLYDLELKKAQNAEAIKNELVGMDVGQARSYIQATNWWCFRNCCKL